MYRRKPQGWLRHADLMIMNMVLLNLSFLHAYWARFSFGWPFHETEYLALAVIMTLIDLLIAVLGRTYDEILHRGYYMEFAATVEHVAFVFIALILFLFNVKLSSNYSRILIYITCLFYVVFSYLGRIIYKKIKNDISVAPNALFLITNSTEAPSIIQNIRNDKSNNVFFCGACIYNRDMKGQVIEDVPVLANMDDLYHYLCRSWVDEVVIHMPLMDLRLPELRRKLVEMGITVHIDLCLESTGLNEKHFVDKIGNTTVLTAAINYTSTLDYVIKRVFDIVAGFFGSVFTLILCIFLAPPILIKSPGPLFFKQERIGKNGKKFKMYKFRSMCTDADKLKDSLRDKNTMSDNMMFKLDWDPRIIGNKILPDGTRKTGIGEFIRKTSLDEFPQFFNVLKGDMSLVGTRPPTLDEWEKYDLHHRARLAVMPGITGMWQVSGRSDITNFEEVVRLDTEYLINWSIGLDIRIILKTIKIVLKREGAK